MIRDLQSVSFVCREGQSAAQLPTDSNWLDANDEYNFIEFVLNT